MQETPWYFVGVDLGQVNDYTAICVVERIPKEIGPDGRPAGLPEQGQHYGRRTKVDSQLHVRHLERLPLGMSYVAQAEHIRNLVHAPELQSYKNTVQLWGDFRVVDERGVPPGLAIDATGAGRPLTNLLTSYGLKLDPVTLHGGEAVTYADGFWRIPKRDLVSVLPVALQSGWLKIAQELELAETLRQELLNFKIKIDPKTAHDSYSHWRENEHDDLVLATGMAAWAATKRQRHFLTGVFKDGMIPAVG